jgi:hypothetical protein
MAAARNCRFQNTTGGGCGYFRNNPTSMLINNNNDPIATYAVTFLAIRIFVVLG